MALKICVIGCGNHSALVHGPSYAKYVKEYPDTVLAACCDFSQEKAEAYREKFGFERCYTDMKVMLEKEKPDAVCIIVPEPFVCQTSIAVMEMGFHVMLEKPPGLCLAETERMIETAERTGVINQVAFNRRFLPLIQRLKDSIYSYAPNSMQNMLYEFYRYGRTEPSFETTAIHGIDAAKYIMGCDYREVHFAYQPLPQMGEKVVNILMDCVFDNGVQAQLRFCPCTGMILERISVLAQDHTFFLKTPIWDGYDAPGELVHVRAGKNVSCISGLEVCSSQEMFETNGFYEENKTFFENVRSGKKCEHDIRSTLQSVELAESIQKRVSYWKRSG